MEASKKKPKGNNILSSLFHAKKERARRHQADSGHDEGSHITPSASKTPSIVLSASSPILSELKRGSRKDDPSSLSSSLTPSQQIQLLTVSSPSLSHEPSRTRSTSRISSMSSLNTNGQSTSLRSAYSNGDDIIINDDIHHHNANHEQAPSIIRSDRVHRYHFETPIYPGHNDDGASSRFSYNAIHQGQLESSSTSSSTSSLQNSYCQHQHRHSSSSQRHTSRFSLKRPHFSSSFNSFNRRVSHSSQVNNNCNNNNRDGTNVSIRSSTSRRVPHHHGFLGRSLPDFETLVYCSTCEKWIQSRLRYRSGAMVWLASFVL